MIVRILGEGQWELSEDAVADLNASDDVVEQAVAAGDQHRLAEALRQLHDQVRSTGIPVPDDALEDSELILPGADASLADVSAMLDESAEGLIPG